MTLSLNYIDTLKKGKNLLAFSAGIDSVALFFLLLENNIKFDIAIVNYGIRKESIQEEEYAKYLAKKYNLKVYIAHSIKFENNFEKNARDFRYKFFEDIIEKEKYDNLLTAHQLNDQLEWLLMRLSKGAGVVELLGLKGISKKQNYTLIRPILEHSKDELLDYLKEKKYKYFIDSSNSDEKYERNYFRKHFSNKLIEKYKKGIKKSFEYLNRDKKLLIEGYREIYNHNELYIIKLENQSAKTRVIDIYLKKLGYLLSASQRAELQKEKSIVFGGKWAVEIVKDIIFIAPYLKVTMPKKHKEKYRIHKIPPKVRGYYYKYNINFFLKD